MVLCAGAAELFLQRAGTLIEWLRVHLHMVVAAAAAAQAKATAGDCQQQVVVFAEDEGVFFKHLL